MTPPRLKFEGRDPEQHATRAVVINDTLAWWIVGALIGGLGAIAAAAFRVGALITEFDGRLDQRDAQLATIERVNDEQTRRITALEIAITGIGALRDRVDRGFDDLAKRLDRIEGP